MARKRSGWIESSSSVGPEPAGSWRAARVGLLLAAALVANASLPSPDDDLRALNGAQRAVFNNLRHDYPKRIVYELGADGVLTATIGYLKGGTPRRFELKRESR